MWFVFVWSYNAVNPRVAGHFNEQDNVYWIIYRCMEDGPWWLTVLLVVMSCLAVEFGVQQVIRRVRPFDYQILQENEVSRQFFLQSLDAEMGAGGKKGGASSYAAAKPKPKPAPKPVYKNDFAFDDEEEPAPRPAKKGAKAAASSKPAASKAKSKPAPRRAYDDDDDY